MLATTAPTLFDGSTETSSAYAATAASPVTDAIALQRKTDSGGGILDSPTTLTGQPVLAPTSAASDLGTLTYASCGAVRKRLDCGREIDKTVGNELPSEAIVGGSDMSPAEILKAASEAGLSDTIELPTCDVVDESIDTGSKARRFGKYMRIHAPEASGGLTYALVSGD